MKIKKLASIFIGAFLTLLFLIIFVSFRAILSPFFWVRIGNYKDVIKHLDNGRNQPTTL